MSKKPELGDKIYIPDELHISNGEDDVIGGLATIQGIEVDEKLPDDHFNKIFVTVKEVPKGSYNYAYLLENQDRWGEEYGSRMAKPDPDINTPFIEDGDSVNGEIWKDGDIW